MFTVDTGGKKRHDKNQAHFSVNSEGQRVESFGIPQYATHHNASVQTLIRTRSSHGHDDSDDKPLNVSDGRSCLCSVLHINVCTTNKLATSTVTLYETARMLDHMTSMQFCAQKKLCVLIACQPIQYRRTWYVQ